MGNSTAGRDAALTELWHGAPRPGGAAERTVAMDRETIGWLAKQAGVLLIIYGVYTGAQSLLGAGSEARSTATVTTVEETCRVVTAPAGGRTSSANMPCADADRLKVEADPRDRVVVTRSTMATITYKTAKGEALRLKVPISRIGLSAARVGDSVVIAYDSSNPKMIRKPGTKRVAPSGVQWIVFGAVLMVIGGNIGRKPAAGAGGGSASPAGTTSPPERIGRAIGSAVRSLQQAKASQGGKPDLAGQILGSLVATLKQGKGGKSVKAGRAGGYASDGHSYEASDFVQSNMSKPVTKQLPKSRPQVVSRRRGWMGFFS